MRKFSSATVMLLSSAIAIPAFAEQAPPRPADAVPTGQKAAADSVGVEEIVVTAQRRGENLQDVPISVTAVTAARLQQTGITSTADIMLVTPGLQFTQSTGLASPFIRGIGTASLGAGSESSVATYIDGVYIAAPSNALMSLNNIERVEVLKGPQGTLFGRNASGGLIQVITKDPSFTPTMNTSLTYERFNAITASTYLSTGLGEKAAIDLAVRYAHQGKGWGTNRITGSEVNKTDHDFAARSKLLLNLSDDTKLVVTGDYSDLRSSAYVVFSPVPGSTTSTGYQFSSANPWDVDTLFNTPLRNSKNWGFSGDLTSDLGFATFRSITALRNSVLNISFDPGGMPTPAIYIRPHLDQRQFSQELQLLSPTDSAVKWILGVYYFRNDSTDSIVNLNLFPLLTGAPGQINVSQKVGAIVTSMAAFGQVTVPITEQLNLTGGLRFTRDKYHYKNETTTDLTFVPAPFNLSTEVFPDRLDTVTKPTWRLSLDYSPTRHSLFYASYNRGFKGGGFDNQVETGARLKPEIVDAFEVGSKIDAFDRRLRFNTAVFYQTVKNLQLSLLRNGRLNLANAAKTEAYGVEVEITTVPVDGLTLTAAGSYLHSRFTDYPNAPISSPLPGGGNVTVVGDAAGNQTPQQPAKTLNLSANYETSLGGGKLALYGNLFLSSKWYSDPDNRVFQPAYETLSAQISWTDPSDHLRLRVFGRNLTNSQVTTQFGVLDFADVRNLSERRTYGVGIDLMF